MAYTVTVHLSSGQSFPIDYDYNVAASVLSPDAATPGEVIDEVRKAIEDGNGLTSISRGRESRVVITPAAVVAYSTAEAAEL